MNRLSLRNNRLKFIKIAGKLPIILEEFIEYTQFNKGNHRMSICNWLDLQTLGSQPVMPKILPDHYTQLPQVNVRLVGYVKSLVDLRKWRM
jgi:hypothetical protein